MKQANEHAAAHRLRGDEPAPRAEFCRSCRIPDSMVEVLDVATGRSSYSCIACHSEEVIR